MAITQEQIQKARDAANAYLENLQKKYGPHKRPTGVEMIEADRLERVVRDLTTQLIDEGGEVVTPTKQVDPLDTIKGMLDNLNDEQLKELKEYITVEEAERAEIKKNIFVHIPGKIIHYEATDEAPAVEVPPEKFTIMTKDDVGYVFTVAKCDNVSAIITDEWLAGTISLFGKYRTEDKRKYVFDTDITQIINLANHWRSTFTAHEYECSDLAFTAV